MDSFLGKVAKKIKDENPNGYDDLLVVFNNRRAGLFLQRELKKLDDKPFFLPRIVGIDDLVSQLGGLHIVPNEFLLFELYDIHRQLVGDSESFEDFISLADMMLGDFSEIDLYAANAEKLLGNLYDLKQIGEWDIAGTKPSDFQKRYLEFYNSLYSHYSMLRKTLLDRGEAFSGMAYRHVAENIDSLAGNVTEKKIYFVGFNALSKSESAIIKWFVNQGIGILICDGDDYYFKDAKQEAGMFLRQNAERHGIDTCFGNFLADGNKDIFFVNCPENNTQAKAAGSIIDSARISEGIKWGSNSAIVLADEKMLSPMLNSLPSCIGSVNVTMGLPYSMTSVHNMVSKVLALFSNSRDNKFYHNDIVNIFNDAVISRLIGSDSAASKISSKIYADKVIYASAEELRQLTMDIHGADKMLFVFECDGQVTSILATLRKLVASVVENECLKDDDKELEALACLLKTLDHFERIKDKYSYFQRIDTLQRIYLRMAARLSIALYGEPLKDIQLLGVLETRNLDFENLVILSVNEGTIPTGHTSNSLIPYSLKRAFGLPTHEEKDAVYAYNFFRLIQRAKKVWLLYSSDSEGMGKGEPSRFIMQIRDEMAPRLGNINIHNLTVDIQNRTTSKPDISTAQKNGRTMERLKEMADKGFSPSALNRYRNCPLQFYFNDVLGTYEQDELTENIESDELGTFIHDLLCDIFSRDTDKWIRQNTLSNALKELPDTIDLLFQKEVLKGRSQEGKNRLYNEVAKLEISHFLEKEIEKLSKGHSIQMVLTDGLPIRLELPISQPYINHSIFIRGITDRVDYFDGQLRIIDYKTGGVSPEELRVKDIPQSPREVPDKWFQVMAYAWLYCRNSNYNGSFKCGIVPLRSLSSDFAPASWYGTEVMDSSHINQFEHLMDSLLTEIFNPQLPFEANPKKGACDFCPFSRICTKN